MSETNGRSVASRGSVEEQLRQELNTLRAMLDRTTLEWGLKRLQTENQRLRMSANEKKMLALAAKTIRERGWTDWANAIDGILERQ